MAPRILIGTTSFRELRQDGYYYVDKTSFLVDFFQGDLAKVTLLTRPRRFGKTLTMDTLREFVDIRNALSQNAFFNMGTDAAQTEISANGTSTNFSIGNNAVQSEADRNRNKNSCTSPQDIFDPDSSVLFEGLEIMRHPDICAKWMYRYPVVFLSLKDMGMDSFPKALYQYSYIIGEFVSRNAFLRGSPRLLEREKQLLDELERSEDEKLLSKSLRILCRTMEAYYGKPVVLLIDEYDVPLHYAKLNGYYKEMVVFIRSLLGSVLKDNPSLRFAVLTGCLRIAKESIFTGLNNFKCYGISEERFADKIGFTSAEVDKILADFSMSHKKAEVQEWYDGYHFGLEKEMYCPWDVIQYVSDHKYYPDKAPEMYWSNSSGNDIVKSFLEHSGRDVRNKFEILLQNGSIDASLQEFLTYNDLYDSEDNIWTLLYLTGYLTKTTPGQIPSSSGNIGLKIPNKEVYQIYVASVRSWFKKVVKEKNREELLAAFWNGDEVTFTRLLSELLRETISYHDYHENYYHAFLAGLLSSFGYDVKSNDETGEGRSDIIVTNSMDGYAVIIEVKWTKKKEKMEFLTDEALRQINDKRYVASFSDYEKIIRWGIAFCRKSCMAKAETEINE